MNPMTDKAKAVAEMLRKEVPKPRRKDFILVPDGIAGEKTFRTMDLNCPMGLHPQTKSNCPFFWEDLPIPNLSHKHIQDFACWWDSIERIDLGKAIDLIWGARRPNHRMFWKPIEPEHISCKNKIVPIKDLGK